MRLLIVFLGLLLAHFQYLFWFGENGWFDHQKTQLEVTQLTEHYNQLNARNRMIEAEIDNLQHDVEAIEERARLQLERVKPNEQFYRIIPKQ